MNNWQRAGLAIGAILIFFAWLFGLIFLMDEAARTGSQSYKIMALALLIIAIIWMSWAAIQYVPRIRVPVVQAGRPETKLVAWFPGRVAAKYLVIGGGVISVSGIYALGQDTPTRAFASILVGIFLCTVGIVILRRIKKVA